MPRGRIYSSIFLMLVLVLGFASYPSSFPSIGLVFADDDCDDLKGKAKADCLKEQKDDDDDDDRGKSDDKNEKAAKSSDKEDDEDDDGLTQEEDDDDDDRGKSDDKNEKAVKANDQEDDEDDDGLTQEEDDDDDDRGKSDDKNEKAVKANDQEDDEDDDGLTQEEDDDDDRGKSDDKNEKAVKATDREDDDDDDGFTRDDDDDEDDDDDGLTQEDDEDDDRKTTICHFPPGNPLNAHTISVGQHAAAKHMIKHGDTLGPCPNEGPGRGDISVHGIKYSDDNENGMKDSGEKVLDNWEIVLLLSSKTVDTEFTNLQGEYWFDGLNEGTYEIKEVQQPGWIQIEPFGGSYQVILSSDSKIRHGFDFGNSPESFDANELFQELSPNRASSIESADDIISQLMQKIEELENRLQALLLKLESGNYYGNTSNVDSVIRSFGISFDGSSTSKTDSAQSGVSGEVFLESIVTRDNSDKFRVIGGKISIDDTTHDIIFGKARSSSSGPSSEKDSMVLIAQLIDDEGNDHTIKLILDFEKSLEGNFGIEAMNFEIKPQSSVSNDWSISATGQLTVL